VGDSVGETVGEHETPEFSNCKLGTAVHIGLGTDPLKEFVPM